MGIMHQFKISAAAPKKDVSPVGRFRRRMVDAIDLQIDIANADASGQAFNRLRQKWVKGTDGSKELRNVPIPIRRWWWSDDKGVTYVTLKHGSKAIELAPGKHAIEVGQLSELPKQLALVRDAVLAGELDAHAKLATADRAIPKPGKRDATPQKSEEAKKGGTKA